MCGRFVSSTPVNQLALVLGLAAEGQPLIAPPGSDPIIDAIAAALRDDRSEAEAALRQAERREPFESLTWEVSAVLRSHWGEDSTQAVAAASFLHGSPLRFVAGPPATVTYEIGSLHIYPRDELVQGAQRLIPAPPWPWALERFLPSNR